jgi:spore coat protein U-like protein
VKWIRALIMAIIVTGPAEAWAQECTVSTVAVNFGDYDTYVGSPVDSTGSINVSCDTETGTTVKLDAGLHSSGTFNPRRMSGSGNYLNYGLYTDASHTMVWGDGAGSTFTQPGGSNVIVYGRIPALQKVRPGAYSDSVTIVVEW